MTSRGVEFRGLSTGIARERNVIERRVDVRTHGLVAENRFRRQEAAGSNRDSLVANRNRILGTGLLPISGTNANRADAAIGDRRRSPVRCAAIRGRLIGGIVRNFGGFHFQFHRLHALLLFLHLLVLQLDLP